MSSSPEPGDNSDLAIFGSLTRIPHKSFVDLASRLRLQLFNVNTANGYVLPENGIFYGGFNMVHVVQLDQMKMVIRIPAYAKHGCLDDGAQNWFKSQMRTLRYIKDNTNIPVQQVYDYDVTTNNEIGAPFIAMSYISGTIVSMLWHDSKGPTPLEERRLRILSQLAGAMSQLNTHHFDKIGSLSPTLGLGGDHIGKCFGWEKDENDRITICGLGPFQSALSFMKSYRAPVGGDSFQKRGTAKFLKMILRLLPDQSSNFVLAPYDFDWQNVMADERGNLTGILDWDNAQTMPSSMGCLKFPVWIQRGYDDFAAMFRRSPNVQAENRRYRAYYAEQMRAALDAQGHGEDVKHTLRSHIFDAVWVAYTDTSDRIDTCREILKQAKGKLADRGDPIPDGLRFDNPDLILIDLHHKNLDGESLAALKKGVKAVLGLEE